MKKSLLLTGIMILAIIPLMGISQTTIEIITLDSLTRAVIGGVQISNPDDDIIGRTSPVGKALVSLENDLEYLIFSKDTLYKIVRIDTLSKTSPNYIFLSPKPKPPIRILPPIDNPEKNSSVRKSFFVNFDEDWLAFFDNQDRNYSGGISFDFMRNASNSKISNYTIKKVDDAITYLGHGIHIKPHANRHITTSGFSIGTTGFTPDSINTTSVLYNDRPYASLLYINFIRTSIDIKHKLTPEFARTLSTSEFTVGIIGTHAYHYLQNTIHVVNRWVNMGPTPYDAVGWNNQISNKGEPTINYAFSKKYVLTIKDLDSTRKTRFQSTLAYRVSAGYFTGFSLDFQSRWGWIKSNPLYFNTNRFGSAASATKTSKGREFFPFIGIKPIFVLRNNLISGQFKNSVHTLAPITEANWFILEGDIGFGWNFNKKVGVYYFYRFRSPEGNKASGYPQRIHKWGGIYLNFYMG
jgi:Uncharacterized protein conserved in bacteria (DUF2219)